LKTIESSGLKVEEPLDHLADNHGNLLFPKLTLELRWKRCGILFLSLKYRKKSPTAVHHLTVNNDEITSEPDIANTFGHTFSSNSSSEHYTDAFNADRQKVEKQPLKFKSNNNETYNCLFSLQELTAAIEKSSDSAVGPDDIHYQILKHLPQSALLTLYSIS